MADNSIAGFGTPGPISGIRPIGADRPGRQSSTNSGGTLEQGEGGKYSVKGHINVAHGNFDSGAPRGTYLDILV
jgi:hypothetical protein